MIVVVMLSSAADMKKVIRCQQPHQLVLVAGLDVVGDDVETAVRVDQVDDRHGADQEHQYLARVAQVVDHVVADILIVPPEAEDRPYGSAHQQCDGRFVDLNFVLQRDEGVAHHEEQDHCQDHTVSYFSFLFQQGACRPVVRLVGSMRAKVMKFFLAPLQESGIFLFPGCKLRFFAYLCPALEQRIELWCNGNTADFGSVVPGSSPGSSTKLRQIPRNMMIAGNLLFYRFPYLSFMQARY